LEAIAEFIHTNKASFNLPLPLPIVKSEFKTALKTNLFGLAFNM